MDAWKKRLLTVWKFIDAVLRHPFTLKVFELLIKYNLDLSNLGHHH